MDGGGEASVKHAGCKKYVVELCVGYGNFRMNELISCRVCVFVCAQKCPGEEGEQPLSLASQAWGRGGGENFHFYLYSILLCRFSFKQRARVAFSH